MQRDPAKTDPAAHADLGAAATATPAQVHEVAAIGVGGAGQSYPHAETIQRAFGRSPLQPGGFYQ